MSDPNYYIDDLDFSNKDSAIFAHVTKGVGIALGLVLGSIVGGLIGGFAFGGSLSILAGVGIGLVTGSLLGYVIAVVSTSFTFTRNTKQKEDRKSPQESHDAKRADQDDYSSSMGPLLSLSQQKSRTDVHEKASEPSVSQGGLNFRRVGLPDAGGSVPDHSQPMPS